MNKMSPNLDDLKRGKIELLILHLLSKGDQYGYQLAEDINEKSEGVFVVLYSSLYPVLHRLEDAGYISEYTKSVSKRRTRKYYHLEEAGIQHYKDLLANYIAITKAINKILDG